MAVQQEELRLAEREVEEITRALASLVTFIFVVTGFVYATFRADLRGPRDAVAPPGARGPDDGDAPDAPDAPARDGGGGVEGVFGDARERGRIVDGGFSGAAGDLARTGGGRDGARSRAEGQ